MWSSTSEAVLSVEGLHNAGVGLDVAAGRVEKKPDVVTLTPLKTTRGKKRKAKNLPRIDVDFATACVSSTRGDREFRVWRRDAIRSLIVLESESASLAAAAAAAASAAKVARVSSCFETEKVD